MRRAERLRQRREFTRVYQQGRAYRSELLVLRALATGAPSRFGFTASAAIGNAVTRNRLKRRLREAIRSLRIQAGWDIVLNARRGAGEAEYGRLRGQVSELLGRAGLLEGSAEEST